MSFPPLARNKQAQQNEDKRDHSTMLINGLLKELSGGIMFKQSAHQTEFRLEEEALYSSNTTHVFRHEQQ